MVFKNFRLNVIVRIMVLVFTIFLFLLSILSGRYYITPVLFGILIIIEIAWILNFIEKTNRDLTGFFESIRFSDFSKSFLIEGMGSSFDELNRAFNNVIRDFQKIRADKEAQHFYLQNVIQHIDIAILAYTETGDVIFINDAARKLFRDNNLKNIKSISKWKSEMEVVLLNIKPGESKLIKIQEETSTLQLSIYATYFKVQNQVVRLVSVKNIQSELDEQELDSWQKLIRVLTHEIMNSIAPIASLTSSMNLLIEDVSQSIAQYVPPEFDMESIEDIKEALVTIHKRSSGLIHFVETYRSLTKIPKPVSSIFTVKQLLMYIEKLLEEEIIQREIICSINVEPENLEVFADEQLIEQVIINMLKNSINSLEMKTGERIIKIHAFKNNVGKTLIKIKDNGQGILPEVLDKIFIPFFTTKIKGSGIGLSLSKQIMRLHGGTITVQSIPNQETCFTLVFNS